MKLPTNRLDAWQFYARLEGLTRAHSAAAWRDAERWLGRNDLFYLMTRLLRREDVDKDWLFDRCREVETQRDGYLDLWAREHGKDLADDTPILTHNRGWTTHGDLAVGDRVYDDYGAPRTVVGLSGRYTDSACYRLTFSDGAQIVAGAGHLWRVRKKRRLRVGDWRVGRRQVDWEECVVPTEFIGVRDDVGALQEPLYGTPAQLPLDPYVLGAWLGDGTTGGTGITAGLDDADEMEGLLRSRGIVVRRVTHSNAVTLRLGSGRKGHRLSSDFANAARQIGVYQDKHIPECYLRASAHQRLMLLRGLMDTDGTCNTRGTASFAAASKRLARDVYDLAAGLALRPRWRSYRLGGSGPYAGREYHQVSMQAHADRPPFVMRRKVERCIQASAHRNCRDVISIDRIASVPTRCIQVEGGIYLAGRELVPTHNSSLITFGLTIQDVLRDPETTIGIFSHTRPIAKGFLVNIKTEFEQNDYLKALYSDILWQEPRKEAQRWSEDGGIIVRRKTNPKEATVEAWGLVDGQPTGKHFRLRIYDDVVTRESVTTPEQVQKTTAAWELSLNLGMQAELGGRARYIGTRYSLHDTYATMLEREAVKPRIYPATHNGRFDGRPVLFSRDEWMKRLREASRTTIAAQMLQNPMADEDATFRTEWLRSYEVRPRNMNVYIMADPSRGRHATSDNTAIAVIGVAPGGAKFFIDGYCHRMPLSQRWTKLRDLYKKWGRARGVQSVAVGYERYGAQSDDEYFLEQMGREKFHFTISELNWPREGGNSKKERVERLEPDFRNGRLYLPCFILHDGQPCTWKVERDADSKEFGAIRYDPVRGLSAAQMAAVDAGSEDLIAKSIKAADSEGRVYDVTARLIEEYSQFPFGMHDDLIDAASRIYDMDAHGPTIVSKSDTEPRQYWDS